MPTSSPYLGLSTPLRETMPSVGAMVAVSGGVAALLEAGAGALQAQAHDAAEEVRAVARSQNHARRAAARRKRAGYEGYPGELLRKGDRME